MDKETVEEFSKYRLEKAKETLNTAEFILKELKDTQVLIIELIMQYFMQLELFLH